MNDNKIILIVDDESNSISALKNILEDETYTTRVAKNGERAIELAERIPQPDLILLDVKMPGMDGFEVCKRLKESESTRKIPIIFVTIKSESEDEMEGLGYGAVDYLTKPINPPIVLQRVAIHLSLTQIEDLTKIAHEAVAMLGEAAHRNDTDTGAHIFRMADYSEVLARAAGWADADLLTIKLAALLHDTGKIGISDTILGAPRSLTKDEWEVMKSHSVIGAKILSHSKHPLFQMAAEIAVGHHENWDGSGYPDGASGEDIPESARIVAVADVFDALTMERSYKKSWSVDEAFSEIRKLSGKNFEPRLVDLFFDVEDEIRQLKKKWDERDAAL